MALPELATRNKNGQLCVCCAKHSVLDIIQWQNMSTYFCIPLRYSHILIEIARFGCLHFVSHTNTVKKRWSLSLDSQQHCRVGGHGMCR